MISIKEAALNGITKLRRPNWANREDYIEIDIISDDVEVIGQCVSYGPWVRFYSPMNEILGEENPKQILIMQFDTDEVGYEIWQAPEGVSNA